MSNKSAYRHLDTARGLPTDGDVEENNRVGSHFYFVCCWCTVGYLGKRVAW